MRLDAQPNQVLCQRLYLRLALYLVELQHDRVVGFHERGRLELKL